MENERWAVLNDKPVQNGDYVLYWMQQSQRVSWNHALAYAIRMANSLKQGVLAVFGLTDGYPEANLRHYTFMLEGLEDALRHLHSRGIRLIVQKGHPPDVAAQWAKQASCVVCDVGYLRHQRAWRALLAEKADCRVVQVETDVIVPVSVVSGKAEYAARTLRPKITQQHSRFLFRCQDEVPAVSTVGPGTNEVLALLDDLNVDRTVPPVSHLFKGGETEAINRFERFITECLPYYAENRNQPQTDVVSHMGMYLHFGQISPLYLLDRVNREPEFAEDRAAFVEELLVRRELAINHVVYNPHYDSYEGLPSWARQTLADHANDPRKPCYSEDELDRAGTHDPYWNAAMLEMKHTGYMHNYMRMYWGKKILEWAESPQVAFEIALRLNNRYFLDGRDPNSYAGVGWIFGLHDRPWKERPIFGKTRYMAATGLERKCDIAAYVAKVRNRITG